MVAAVDVPVPRAHRRSQSNTARVVSAASSGPSLDELARLERGEGDAAILADRYRVERWLGRGGMASIFAGLDLDSGRRVAVKILTEVEDDWEGSWQRFVDEARLGSQIRHQNVVEFLDWGTTPKGIMYVVTELLDGEDLRKTLEAHALMPWPRARDLMLQLCAGLAAVHERGFVHRDVKPANCFVTTDADGVERLKLIDFGIATNCVGRELEDGVSAAIIGTPHYMAPEQARGESVDARADIYAAGIILFELLTGHAPVDGKTSGAILMGQVYGQIPSLRQIAPPQVEFDPRLEAICAKALAKHPDERYCTITQLHAALAAIPGCGSGPGSRVEAQMLDDGGEAEPGESDMSAGAESDAGWARSRLARAHAWFNAMGLQWASF